MSTKTEAVSPRLAGLIRPALTIFVVLSILTGLLYPMAVTGIAQIAFPDAANGSLITVNGKVVGSELIGQAFIEPKYFWGRPSATTPMPYNAANSAGSNQGPANPALSDAAKSRVEALRAADPGNTAPVPVDLVTASASGLDPDISRAAADYQLGRVARARGLPEAAVREVLEKHTQWPRLAFLGEARVNVLKLNLAVDQLKP